ncbi:hypothetical protein BH24ACI3_BH24ACI3_09840 [soil metagenome]
MRTKVFLFSLTVAVSLFASGCSMLDSVVNSFSQAVGLADTAIVIAKSAQIRTSYAVVAADLLEVKRGDRLDVLDQIEFEKILWYRVRARDEENTEGWIEAQNVITNEVLEKSQELAAGFKETPSQAGGKLRAASNLRLAPEMNAENVLFRLANGSTFEIMDWSFVPKEQVGDVDDSTTGEKKVEPNPTDADIAASKVAGDPEKIEEKYDVWYLIRLDPSVSPAPAGWLFGRQVELNFPTEVVFFQQNNKKFVAWQRLDSDIQSSTVTADRTATPGSWVLLTRTNVVRAIDGVEPDFDGIVVLAFDKYDQNYYTAWRSTGDMWGMLPLRVEGSGDNKTFSVQVRHPEGRMDEKRFVVFRDRNRLRITPPEDIAQYMESKRR